MIVAPASSKSQTIAVGASSAVFARVLETREHVHFVSSTACYVSQGATGGVAATAGAGTGSMYVPANEPVILSGLAGAYVAVIQASAGGFASLTPVIL